MAKAYRVVRIVGVKPSARRGVAYLACPDDDEINAKAVIERLSGATDERTAKRRRELFSRIDFWIEGGRQDSYFHGWPNEPKFKHCFVFKWKDSNRLQRLYGFLCNPTDGAFQLCVLVSHAEKSEWLTEPKEKIRAETLRNTDLVQKAVAREFPERWEKQWIH